MKLRISTKITIILIILLNILNLIFADYIIFLYVNHRNEQKANVYIANQIDNLIDKKELIKQNDLDNLYTSVLLKDNDRYKSIIYNKANGNILSYKDLIKKEYHKDFNNKVKELLYLKYPSFIADALINNKNNVYYFQKNKLTIYYYDYLINPQVDEELSLTINYNEIEKYLTFKPILDKTYQNEDGFNIKDTDKVIAITFDDGPCNYTSLLVDILNQNKAHATFFYVTNRIENYKDGVLKAHKSGEEIAYHSYAHKNFKKQELSEIINEYNESNEIIKSITGSTYSLTRPPYGSINDEIKNNLNTKFILWNKDTNDWKYKDTEVIKKYVLDNVEDGDIILFHELYETSINAIKDLLPILYSKGYRVVTVSQLANIKGQTIENNQIYRSFK